MARNKIGLQFEGWEDYIAKLDKVGGSAAMKSGVEQALKKSKEHITPKIEKAVSPSNLPAKGKYSASPHAKDTIDREVDVTWENNVASIKVGFDLKKAGGFTSIYLMYGTHVNGTPRMKPAKGLKAAIYGANTKKEVAEIQQEAISDVIKKIMEG